MPDRKSLAAIGPLFLVLFIDGMGLSLLFPVLNAILIDPHFGFLPITTSLEMRNFLYGSIIGIFMICWFFGAAIWGDLSDKIGRKKSLLICLLGAFLGYLLSAGAVTIHNLTFLIVGRVIAGFTAGSQPIAQAAIVDVSPKEQKARNIGLILLSVSLGFIIGPLIGGVLSNNHLVGWFDFSTPLYFAALISLTNAILLWVFFQETFIPPEKVSIKLHHAVDIFVSAFKHKKVRKLSVVLLVMIYGWGNFFAFISIFVLRRYGFTPLKVSLLLADLGLGFSIGSGYLIDFFATRFQLKPIITISFFLTAIFVFLIIVTHQPIYLWILVVGIGTSIAVGYSALVTLFSNQVSEQEQGWVMGVTGAIMALCFGLTSFSTAYFASFNANIPIILAVAGIAISGVLMAMIKRHEVM